MGTLRNTYYFLPPGMRRLARRVWYLPGDLADSLTGRRGPMVPPKGKIFIGSGDFTAAGEAIREQLVTLAGLQPSHRILDVGCGMGRVAVPLTAYLDEKGSYEGFDIVPSAIHWCRKRISSRYSQFRFTHIDLKNDLYNLRTDREAKDFVFPYGDGEFDLVFLTSVFTHMLLEDVRNYLLQIRRVLKPRGACFATFFLMNRDTEEQLRRSGKAMFTTRREHHYLFHPRVKEANVAYDEKFLFEQLVADQGFRVEQVVYGFWPGREHSAFNNYQDICVFRKV
ncbi:MAG: class I SAM-dependent methyltransferase [Bacteroidales bacterium]